MQKSTFAKVSGAMSSDRKGADRGDPRSNLCARSGRGESCRACFPLSEIPFQAIVDGVADGTYKAKPARVFRFAEIQTAHRLMESDSGPGGKLVVKL